MNQDLNNHPLFETWMSDELAYGMYDLTKDLTLVVHQSLTLERSTSKNYLGTILDVKHRVGKEQTIYRLQEQDGKFVCVLYYSEAPFTQTVIALPEGTIMEMAKHIINEVIR